MLILPLDGNHEIVKVRICINEELQSEVDIKYAQNGITSELLNFGRKTVENGQEVVFEQDIPVSASHIYIFTSNPKRYISEVEVFERTPSDFALCYPRCIDIDIKENYYLDTVSVLRMKKGIFIMRFIQVWMDAISHISEERIIMKAAMPQQEMCFVPTDVR